MLLDSSEPFQHNPGLICTLARTLLEFDGQMRALNRLSALEVKNASKPGLYMDGGGLCLQVSSTGTKSWIFRFMLNGRARKMGLGPLSVISLAEARKRAGDARLAAHDGIDPLEARKALRASRLAEEAKAMTFKQCGEAYIAAHIDSWKNAKHREQWLSTLKTYAYPKLGALPVASIDTALVVKVIEPIWKTKTETASRLRGRIEQILDWATVREFRKGDNPARWRGHLQNLLPAKEKIARVEHHPAMPYAELPAFMKKLRRKKEVSAKALEFTILTAARTSEAIGATWAEFDLANKVWTVPSIRMKARREHKVPLSPRALEILAALPRTADHVFPSRNRKGEPSMLSNMAMLELLRGMADKKLTVHGFRSAFLDWGHEQSSYAKEALDMALAHTVGDKVEAAYRRGDMFAKRRNLMDTWATYCASEPAKQGDNVVAIGAAR